MLYYLFQSASAVLELISVVHTTPLDLSCNCYDQSVFTQTRREPAATTVDFYRQGFTCTMQNFLIHQSSIIIIIMPSLPFNTYSPSCLLENSILARPGSISKQLVWTSMVRKATKRPGLMRLPMCTDFRSPRLESLME